MSISSGRHDVLRDSYASRRSTRAHVRRFRLATGTPRLGADADHVAGVHERRHVARPARSRGVAGLTWALAVAPLMPGAVSDDLEIDRRRQLDADRLARRRTRP